MCYGQIWAGASEGVAGRAAERVSFIRLAAGAGCWLGAHLELSTGAHAAWASCRMMAGFQNEASREQMFHES